MVINSSSRTYSGLGYEPTYFARKHRISKQQARDLLRKYGHDRDKLNAAAMALSAQTQQDKST